MFSIKTYLLSAVGIGILFMGVMYFVTNYFHMKTALKITSQELKLAEHRRQETEVALVEVENDVDRNLSVQRKALLEMERQGYISTRDNANPEWMLDFETESHQHSKNS